jgi:hypothetical protein
MIGQKDTLKDIVMAAMMASSGLNIAMNCNMKIEEEGKTTTIYDEGIRLLCYDFLKSVCKEMKIETRVLRTPFALGFSMGGTMEMFSLESTKEIDGYFDSKLQMTFIGYLENDEEE